MNDLETIRAALQRKGSPSSDFDLNKDVMPDAGRVLRPAGVLAAITEGKGGLELILTKRSSAMKHHPGQIAFPGGKKDEGDQDIVATALREAQEEIGLPQKSVEVLGTLPSHETVTGFDVTPVIGFVNAPFAEVPEPGEVAEVFRVPLMHVLTPQNYIIQSRRWRGKSRAYFTVPFGPYYIWGATARILRAWSDRMT